MKGKYLLLLAALLLLLSAWKLLHPERTEALRAWVEETLFPETRETVEAWGRTLAGEEAHIAVLGPGESP